MISELNTHICAGTVTSKDSVLTSKNCCDKLKNLPLESFTVMIGSHNLRIVTSKERNVQIKGFVAHPTRNVCIVLTDKMGVS